MSTPGTPCFVCGDKRVDADGLCMGCDYPRKAVITTEEIAHLRESSGLLLEALREIVENAEYQRGTTYEIHTRFIEKAEAAIAQAEGK